MVWYLMLFFLLFVLLDVVKMMARSPKYRWWLLTAVCCLVLNFVPSCSERELADEKEIAETDDYPIFTQQLKQNIPDSLIQLDGEDYPVINEMLRSYQPHHVKLAGNMLASNQVWMKSDSINQTLAFVIGTDYQREKIFHFYTDRLPQLMTDFFEFKLDNGKAANKEQGESIMHSYMKSSARVDQRFFKSKLDFVLGDLKGKAIRTHGKPDQVRAAGNLEEFTWIYTGVLAWTEKADLRKKPLIKASAGQIIRMYFEGQTLIGMMVENLPLEKKDA